MKRAFSSAYVSNHNGLPTLFINGEPWVTPAYVTYLPENNCYRQFADAGIHLYSACIFFGGQTINVTTNPHIPTHPGIFDRKGYADFTEPDKVLRSIVEADPQAKIFPRVNISPPRWWEEEHPDELIDKPFADREGAIRRVCFASDMWQQQEVIWLQEMIEYYANSEFAEHLMGFQLACGNTEEWLPFDMNCGIGQRSRDKAEGLLPPDPAFYQKVAEQAADAIAFLAGKVKEMTDRQVVVGAFFGYTVETPFKEFAHGAVSRLLRCPDVDFLCSPASYAGGRKPGIDHACMTVLDSVLCHGKLYFTEADFRTYRSLFPFEYRADLCEPGTYNSPLWKGPQDPFVSRHLLRNVFSRQLIHGNNFWWFDMWGGFYDDDEMMGDIRKEVQILQESLNLPCRKSASQVAVLFDERCHDYCNGQHDYVSSRFRIPLGHSGVPYDIYEIADFEDIKDRYQVFVLIEPCHTAGYQRVEQVLQEMKKPFLRVEEETPLSPALFRDFFAANGVHVYCHQNAVIYANEHYLSVCNGENAQDVTVYLPTVREITQLLEEGNASVDREFVITMKSYEHRLYRLK